MLRPTLTMLATTALLAACNPDDGTNPQPSDSDADIEGRVSDSDSTARVGGSGSIEAASTVQAVVVRDGEAVVIGEADVDANAEYAIELDESAEGETVMLRAMDDADATVASTLITRMDESDDGDVYIAAPMSTETSVEAEVWLSSQLRYGDDGADAAEVRVRVDVDASVAVRDSSDMDSDIDALADAMVASAAAEAKVWADAGATLDDRTRADATAQAMAQYDLALAEGGELTDSWADVRAARTQAAIDAGLTARERADASSASNLLVRAVLDARATADVSDRMTVASGMLEAHATSDALVELYASSQASSEARTMADDAAAQLRADADAASDLDAMAGAWADYEASLVGDGSFEGSLMDSTFDLSAVGEVALAEAVDGSAEALAALEANIATALSLETDDTLDVDTLSNIVVSDWADSRSSVTTSLELLFSDNADAAFAAELVLDANGRFAVVPD